jgi:hypothetical protein
MPEASFDELLEAMRASVEILQNHEIPFALGGGLAAWAHGGPRSEHDVDLIVAPEHAEPAMNALAGEGLRTGRPPEGWLYKAWHDNGVLIDLIFEPAGGPYTIEQIELMPKKEVAALRIRVLPAEDILASKLLALTEQDPDYSEVLEMARALREQIDWPSLQARTAASPFAAAFFTLTRRLGIDPRSAGEERRGTFRVASQAP